MTDLSGKALHGRSLPRSLFKGLEVCCFLIDSVRYDPSQRGVCPVDTILDIVHAILYKKYIHLQYDGTR